MKQGAAREELERKKGALREEIDRLEKELEQRKKQLLAHSIRPHQLLAIEEIEDRIGLRKDQLRLVEERILGGEGS